MRLKTDIKPIKHIHKEFVITPIEPIKPIKPKSICQAIYKSGFKTGKPCTIKAKQGTNYCGIHKHNVILPPKKSQINSKKKIITNLCQATYKTGNKVGQTCISKAKPGTNYCGVHKV